MDRRYYLGDDGRLRSWVNYTDEELAAFTAEAHRLGRKAAAHAIAWDGIDAALRNGFDTIEHGHGLTPGPDGPDAGSRRSTGAPRST